MLRHLKRGRVGNVIMGTDNIKACRYCKSLFYYVTGDRICPKCRDEQEQLFAKVKDYIWNHKNCRITEVVQECDCSMDLIHKWLREERLQIENTEGLGLFCSKCGKPLNSGTLCIDCKNETAQMLNSLLKTSKNNKTSENTYRIGSKFHTAEGKGFRS